MTPAEKLETMQAFNRRLAELNQRHRAFKADCLALMKAHPLDPHFATKTLSSLGVSEQQFLCDEGFPPGFGVN